MSWTALLIVILSVTPDSGRAQAYDLYLQGSSLEDQGRYEEALRFYLAAREQDPASLEILHTISKAYVRMKRFDQALKYARQAHELDPKNPESIKLLGMIHLQRFEIVKALRFLELAYELNPQDDELIASLSYLYEGFNQFDKARTLLEKITAADPSAANLLRLGQVMSKMGKNKEALPYYQQALRADTSQTAALLGIGTSFDLMDQPDSAVAYYELTARRDTANMHVQKRLVDLYTRLDRYEELIELCTKLLKSTPLEHEVRRNLGYGLYKKGEKVRALEEFLIAAAMNPQDSYGLFHAARIYVELGQFKSAEKMIKRAIAANPTNTDLVTYLGFVYLDLKDYDAAALAFRQAVTLGGDRSQLFYLLGVTTSLQRKYRQAYDFYKKAIAQNPKDPKPWGALAYLCDDLGRKKEALSSFEAVIKLDTLNASALNYVGYTYAEQGVRLEHALKLIERAVAMEDTNGYFIDSLGWVYFIMGRYEEAVEQLEKAASRVEDGVILEHLGDAYLKTGSQEKAKEAYEKGLNKTPKSKSLKKKLADLR